MQNNAISVRQLNMYVKSLLEGDSHLVSVTVMGEISNFKNHYSSGHWYFTLKDSSASIRCVMFRGAAVRVKFSPQDGMSVVLKGRVSIYEKDGQYQFYTEEMHDSGEGDIALAFKQIKEKLEAEGLFAPENKRPLTAFPKKIAVITSDTGAAVEDIKKILARRYPICDVVMCPVTVQGVDAASSMITTLDRVYALAGIDTIIIGRGGGSAEDLSAFNDEKLARKIYESPFPVISAVGHETDFTICDFVADVRAATPSAAAELAVPDTLSVKAKISDIGRSLSSSLEVKYRLAKSRYDIIASKAVLAKPLSILSERLNETDILSDRILKVTVEKINDARRNFDSIALKIDAMSPIKTMMRGYAVPSANGKVIKSVSELSVDRDIKITFPDGYAKCTVKEKTERDDSFAEHR